jgi:hypothetical protein
MSESTSHVASEQRWFGEPSTGDAEAITRLLRAPFAVEDVRFKPAVVSGNRALAIAYVDARVIQDRLDEVLGVGNWQDAYECLADGNVVCRLRLRINGEWVTKVDVGSQSEGGDDGDKVKGAFSDSLKRAAVKFGVGRYLYHLPSQWLDYDQQKRCFVKSPKLPSWALPSSNGKGLPGKASIPSKDATTKVQRLSVDEMFQWQETLEAITNVAELNGLLPKIAALGHKEDRLDVFHAAEHAARKLELSWSQQSKLFVVKAK